MQSNNIMAQIIKKLFVLTLIVVAIFSFAACSSRNLSTNPTAYYIIYSGTNNGNSRIEGVDIDGNPTILKDISATNISKSMLAGEQFIAGGHRANNHLIMQQDGSFEEFYLLDNPQYSGVWNIALNGENIVAVMNGNIDYEKNVYLNLLVIQDINKNLYLEKQIEITPNTLFIDGDTLYLSGCFWRYDIDPVYCGASVAKYNIITGEWQEKHFQYNANQVTATDYIYSTKYGKYLYAVVNESLTDKNLSTRQTKVDIIDCDTLDIVDTIHFNKNVNGICCVGENIYIVIADKLYKLDTTTHAVEEIYSFPQDTTIASVHTKDEHIYFNSRYITVRKDNQMRNVGYIIDFNTADKSAKQTPLITDAKNTESIVFFPLSKNDLK